MVLLNATSSRQCTFNNASEKHKISSLRAGLWPLVWDQAIADKPVSSLFPEKPAQQCVRGGRMAGLERNNVWDVKEYRRQEQVTQVAGMLKHKIFLEVSQTAMASNTGGKEGMTLLSQKGKHD
jgi:hypothetical protein